MITYKTLPKQSGASKQVQLRYNERAKADKILDVLVIPEKVIADATAGELVGKGTLLRVKGVSGGFITFGEDSTVPTPMALTGETLETPADFFFVVATNEFVKTSTAMRIEVIED